MEAGESVRPSSAVDWAGNREEREWAGEAGGEERPSTFTLSPDNFPENTRGHVLVERLKYFIALFSFSPF